ncbi:E3 ubiquitin-protein ligase LRSAM1 isoform X2 [Parasteatoda tepidariorum]|uniref:E3 ubiquitin-protein ligase LRSAM1 isoform X2 n=1 Tax=Parasteatoda tepidariorum TaxID=114398 RepID=UPI001C726F6D|nr:E3 ubiquitin-protein ligase LRSAM1 isoform X2 [Parasteatoda tepidariorum]
MPFWGDGGKAENYKAKLEHKMCIAKEAPESTFDISDCNLSEVPSGVYSMCRVFRKEALLLQTNQLTSLQNGGSLKDLSDLIVLNVHNNKLHSLPDEIGYLTHLQELNLEKNRLKKLPVSIGKLTNLRSLNLKSNNLQSFPLAICSIQCLQSLDICNNPKIKTLPKELCNLVSLNCFNLDAQLFTYPNCDICLKGVESIQRFLCNESGREYCLVSSPSCDVPSKTAEHTVYNTLESPDFAEQRQLDLRLMEEALKESLVLPSAADTSIRKKQLMDNIALEQDRMENEILLLQKKKEKEKQNLLSILSNVENHSAKLINKLMELNDKRQNLENMAAVLEKDRIDNEELFSIKQEELDQLRKKEVLEAMKEMLLCEENFGKYEARRYSMAEEIQNDENESKLKLFNIFHERELDQQILINRLLEEEQYQKKAFEVLQQQKDLQHQQIAHQIQLIEKELSNLSAAEMEKKNLKISSDINTLSEHRIALACLLTGLLTAKEQRERELKERLLEMEARHAHEMEDFWLLQYQKLLDMKPKGITIAELTIDDEVKDLLLNIPAPDLIPLFAMKGITIEDLLRFTVRDLKKIGVLDEDICEAILGKALTYFEGDYKRYALPKFSETPEPSAPPDSDESPELEELSEPATSAFEAQPEEMRVPSAPPFSPDTESKLWCHTECVICMDLHTSIVFLPCGHVCCCQKCSEGIELCPMCRTTVTSKFVISFS